MDSNEHNKVIAFDTLFCTNHIQMLKVMLPYMDNQTQKSMAIYIKFLELNYTIDYFKKHPYPLCGCVEKAPSPDVLKICTELLPYCNENERKQLEQIRNLIQGMEMYKEMSKTIEIMKDFMPEMTAFNNEGPDESSSASDGGDGLTHQADGLTEQADDPSKQDEDPQTDGTSGQRGSFDMMGMLMNMLTPEQRQMYEMFGGNKNAE